MEDCPQTNIARAAILVAEARRIELLHLTHQKEYLTELMAAENSGVGSPQRLTSRRCACNSLPLHRTLDPLARVENILLPHYPKDHVSIVTRQLLEKYEGREAQLIDELTQQFGPEPTSDSYAHRLESVNRKMSNLNQKWKKIMDRARLAARQEDYASVIRHLSVMRIFLEGSQAQTYSCDPMERERRDVVHRSTLQKLGLCNPNQCSVCR